MRSNHQLLATRSSLELVSPAAVLRVAPHSSQTAADLSATFLSIKLTNKRKLSIFWKVGPSLSRRTTTITENLTRLRQTFKFSHLINHRKQAFVQLVFTKKDLFVSLPTGFGKSVIFQALPLVFDKPTPASQGTSSSWSPRHSCPCYGISDKG